MTDEQAEQLKQLFTELREGLAEAYANEFRSRPQLAGGGQPQITFQAVYASALIDLAAELVVDAGMDKQRFIAIAEESFDRGNANAPRFG